MDWFALYTASRCETRAAVDLTARGLAVYLPLSRRWVRPRRATARREVTTPAFTRYLFVGVAGQFDWHRIVSADGVESIVCNNQTPVRIASSLIDFMRRNELSGLFDVDEGHDDERRITLNIGDRVTLSGAFAGHVGTIIRPPKSLTGCAQVLLGSKTVLVPIDKLAHAA